MSFPLQGFTLHKFTLMPGVHNAVSAFEVFAAAAQRVSSDPYRWKWAIIAFHSGLQGMMVLALLEVYIHLYEWYMLD